MYQLCTSWIASSFFYLKGWKNSKKPKSNCLRETFAGVDLLLSKHLWCFAAIDWVALTGEGYDEGFLIKKALSLQFLKYKFKTHKAIFYMSLNCFARKPGGAGGLLCYCANIPVYTPLPPSSQEGEAGGELMNLKWQWLI